MRRVLPTRGVTQTELVGGPLCPQKQLWKQVPTCRGRGQGRHSPPAPAHVHHGREARGRGQAAVVTQLWASPIRALHSVLPALPCSSSCLGHSVSPLICVTSSPGPAHSQLWESTRVLTMPPRTPRPLPLRSQTPVGRGCSSPRCRHPESQPLPLVSSGFVWWPWNPGLSLRPARWPEPAPAWRGWWR